MGFGFIDSEKIFRHAQQACEKTGYLMNYPSLFFIIISLPATFLKSGFKRPLRAHFINHYPETNCNDSAWVYF